jgi:hypothetical protein
LFIVSVVFNDLFIRSFGRTAQPVGLCRSLVSIRKTCLKNGINVLSERAGSRAGRVTLFLAWLVDLLSDWRGGWIEQ